MEWDDRFVEEPECDEPQAMSLELRDADFECLDDALAFVAERLEFPDYFGGNLSALADCLGETGAPGVELTLLVPSRHKCSDWMRCVCRVSRDVASECEWLSVKCEAEDER